MSLTDTRPLCQSALNQKLRFAKLLGSVSLCQSDRCLFDSDRLGVDREAVAPESIFVAQTPLALFKAPQNPHPIPPEEAIHRVMNE